MKRSGYWIGLLLITIGIAGMGLARLRTGHPASRVYGIVPEFSLLESSGRTVTLHDLEGKVWVADFVFTNCAGTCPMMTGKMRKLQDVLPQEIRMVSFSVDPTRDTPQALSAYAKSFGADNQRWWFLTGDQPTLYKLSTEGFKLALDNTRGTDAEPITHSTRFVLVDAHGAIRGYYGGTDDADLTRLTNDAKKLL
jgi:cytochrome oxidase Cu insertion factor (SCO1/SenC/PrrC family)